MLKIALLPGLEFVERHSLTVKEVGVLTPFIGGDFTLEELLPMVDMSELTTKNLLVKLKAKDLILVRCKTVRGERRFGFNDEVIH